MKAIVSALIALGILSGIAAPVRVVAAKKLLRPAALECRRLVSLRRTAGALVAASRA